MIVTCDDHLAKVYWVVLLIGFALILCVATAGRGAVGGVGFGLERESHQLLHKAHGGHRDGGVENMPTDRRSAGSCWENCRMQQAVRFFIVC